MLLKKFYVSSKDTPLTKTPKSHDEADATMIFWKFCDRVSCDCPAVNYFKALGAICYENDDVPEYYFNFKPDSISIDNLRKRVESAKVICQLCHPHAR